MFLPATQYALSPVSVKSIFPNTSSVTLLKNPVVITIRNVLNKYNWKKRLDFYTSHLFYSKPSALRSTFCMIYIDNLAES